MRHLIFWIALIIFSCSQKKDNVKSVYDSKEKMINLFTGKSILRSRGQNAIHFYTHNGDKTNKYFFLLDNQKYQFTNDTIEYSPDVLQLKKERGTEGYKQELTSRVEDFINQMDEMGIRDISSEMAGAGIDLKIYMKEEAVVLYVSNFQNVPGPRFKNYVSSMKKFDDNWYYNMKE